MTLLVRFGVYLAVAGTLSARVRAEAPPDPIPGLLATAKTQFKDIRVETLPNGLKIYLLPVKGAPVVTTMVAYKVGSGDEDKDQTGLSHYLEHLLFKGTDKLKPGDIDRMTQRNGGRNNAYTSEDMTVYHFDFAADRWKQGLEVEADRMRQTRIDEKHEFQQEKGAVISELKGGEDGPWDLEYKAILPLLFPKDAPYHHPVIGEEKHVASATAEIILRHYNKWYHPNNASIVIAGGFDPNEALELVTKLFGKIPKSELPERRPTPKPSVREKLIRKEFTSKFDVARCMIGFNGVKIGTPDDYVFDVLSTVLSSGKTSRLHKRLVEAELLANDISSGNNAGRYPGWFAVQLEMLKGKDRAKAEKIVFEELAKLAEKPITEAELERVRRQTLAAFIFNRESVHSLADLVAKTVTNESIDYLKTYLDRVMAVTPEDIQKAAKTWLVASSAVVVWSVPDDDPQPVVVPKTAPKPGEKESVRKLPARAQAKESTPAGGTEFSLKDVKRVVLKNGLVLLMLENHRLPIIAVEAHVADIRLREQKGQSGIAALVGEMLEEGTAEHSHEQVSAMIENTGGSMAFSSGGGTLKVLSPDIAVGLGLFLECLARPAFPRDSLTRKRDQLLSQIADVETQPQNRAKRMLDAAIYGEHPYGRSSYGEKGIVEKLRSQDLKDFHAAHYVPNRTTLVIVGDFDSAGMAKSVEAMTAAWKPVEAKELKLAAIPKAGDPGEKIFSDPQASQTHVYIGHLGVKRDDPDYHALLVLDNVLGTGPGFTDRLSANLRDRQGLAYTVTASISNSAGEQPGEFVGYIGTFAEKYTWVRDGFLKEVNRIRDEKATELEVEDAKKYLLGSLPFRFTTNEGVASQLLAAEKFHLGFDFIEVYRKKIAAVTVDDVQAAAKKHLDPKKLTIVAVGPIDKTGKALPGTKGK